MEWWPRFGENVRVHFKRVWVLKMQIMLGLIWRVCWTRIKSGFGVGFGGGVALH